MKKNLYDYLHRGMRSKLLLLTGIMWLSAFSLAYAQKGFEYSGNVTSPSGETLPGVSVTVTGTTTGAITDLDGNFKFTADKAAAKLTFSFTGMVSQEVTATAGIPLTIVLEEKSTDLSGIMIVGYGTQKKSLVTGAISQIKSKELESLPSSRVEQAMQGRVAGVGVRSSSGSPGAGLKVRIRGAGSNGNADPLYIVDGMKSGDINYLEPSDVESIEVLKDAASAAIYGAEGANGVVIITTKSGKGGNQKAGGTVTYDFQYGMQSVGKMMPVMNNTQYTEYINAAKVGVTIPENISTNTNWLDQIAEAAPMQKHYLSFSGGNEKSSYMLSGSYFTQDGVVGGEKANFKRYSVRFNGDHEVKNWLSVGNNFAYSHTDRSSIAENSEFGGIVSSALMLDPLTPITYDGELPAHAQSALNDGYTLVKDGSGKYYGVSQFLKGESANPLAQMAITRGNTIQDKFLGSMFATLKPFKGLSITSRVGIDYAGQIYHTWSPKYWFSSERFNNVTSARNNYDKWFTWLWENFATYTTSIEKHNFSVMAGHSAQHYQHNYSNAWFSPMNKEDESSSYPGWQEIDGKIAGIPETKTLESYFGRLTYDYANKYMFNASVRRDGTSLLANKWGVFPSVSAGWVISEESFWKDLSTPINYFKFRASWGQNGSLSNLTPDQFQSMITSSGIQYPKPGGGYYTGAEPELLANPELVWETGQQTDIGVDFRAYKGKLIFSVDYYKKVTKDLLTPLTPPLSMGNKAPFGNAGDVTNKGFEFELGYRESEGDFHYSASINMSTNKNEVTYLNPLLTRLPGAGIGTGWTATYMEEGLPIWYYRGYQTNGIFQNQAEIDKYIADNALVGYAPVPGDPIVVNNKKDNAINESDMVEIGSPHPKLTFGANLSCDYKNFDLNIFLQGSQGNDIIMGWNRTDRGTSNRPEFFYTDRWTGAGSTNSWFRADLTNPYVYNSDLMVFNGSYLRIKQIQLGYTMPKEMAQKLHLAGARIYFSLDDYFTFTKYPGMDPEAGSTENNSQGIDRGMYPTPRKFMTGVSISL